MKKLLSILLLFSIILSTSACLSNDASDSTTEPTSESTEITTSGDSNVIFDNFPKYFEGLSGYQEFLEQAERGEITLPENFITYEQLSGLGVLFDSLTIPRGSSKWDKYDYWLKDHENSLTSILSISIYEGKREYHFSKMGEELLLNMVGRGETLGYVDFDISDILPNFNGVYVQNGVLYHYKNGQCWWFEFYSHGLTFVFDFGDISTLSRFMTKFEMLRIFNQGDIYDPINPVTVFDEMLYGTEQS